MKSEDTHRAERRSQEVSSCLIQTSCGCSGGDSLPHVLCVCVCTDIELVHHPERMQSHTHSHAEVQQKTPASDFIQSREPVSSAAVWNVKFHNVCFSLRVGLETQWIATLDQFILEWVSGEWCQPLRVETEGGSQRYHIYRRSTSHTALVLFEGMCVTGVF